MQWVEVINLRAFGEAQKVSAINLWRQIRTSHKKIAGMKITLYECPMIENDVSIHIERDSQIIDLNGSELGKVIEENLKGLGVIDYVVWQVVF